MRTRIIINLGAAFCFGVSSSANALVVTSDSSAASLLAALLSGGGGGINVATATATLSGHDTVDGTSTGTYTNDSGTYGIGSGVLLSSGDVAEYGDGPNTDTGNSTEYDVPATAAQEALLDPITGGSLDHNDATVLEVMFDMLPNEGEVFFNVTFGSDEYDEFKGSSFIDAFGLYLNGVNIAFVDGSPVNIDHPDMLFTSGTELDGILGGSGGPLGALVHTFSGTAMATGNVLTFILADSGDSSLDSTAYISQLGGSAPPVGPPKLVPAPATLALFGLGLAGLGWSRRKKA